MTLKRIVKPAAEGAVESKPSVEPGGQLALFQSLLANSDEERRKLSHAIDLWDAIPRYSISRKQQTVLRAGGRTLPSQKLPFNYRGQEFTANISPAYIVPRDAIGDGQQEVAFYPSAREELVEHALRKLAIRTGSGAHETQVKEKEGAPVFVTGVHFTIYELQMELRAQGHTMNYLQLVEALEILHRSFIEITSTKSGRKDPTRVSQPYLPMLVKVNREGFIDDPEAKWYVQFHALITYSLNHITYRQFNYARLMQTTTQLARWLLQQLVLKYTQASMIDSFTMRLSTIQRDSHLLDNYTRARDAHLKTREAWEELQALGAVREISVNQMKGERGRISDVEYQVKASSEFIREQKAANGRSKALVGPSVPGRGI